MMPRRKEMDSRLSGNMHRRLRNLSSYVCINTSGDRQLDIILRRTRAPSNGFYCLRLPFYGERLPIQFFCYQSFQ